MKTTLSISILIFVVLVPLSCSHRGPAESGVVSVTYSEALPDARTLLDESVEGHQEALDLMTAGHFAAGEERLAEARDLLARAVAACEVTPDCTADHLLETTDRLVLSGSRTIEAQAERIRVLESREELEEELPPEAAAALYEDERPEIPEDTSSVEFLVNESGVGEWLTVNGPVKAEIDDWLTWRRPLLMDTWVNYRFLAPLMRPEFERAGLSESLLFAMLATESGGKVHSYSRAGAAGPLQFMSYTGRRYGLHEEGGFDLRLDPASSARASAAYLREQLAVLGQSLEKALAAYNGGENRMRGLHRRLGGASLWDTRMYYSLPRETRDYVPRILAAAAIFERPEHFNVQFPDFDATTRSFRLPADAAISELTVCLGQLDGREDGWFRALRNLNPQYGPGEVLEAGTEIVVPSVVAPAIEERCGTGTLWELAQELREANYPPEPEMIRHVVSRGETLSRIASRYRCASLGEISSINGIRAPRYLIRAGQVLEIPTCR